MTYAAAQIFRLVWNDLLSGSVQFCFYDHWTCTKVFRLWWPPHSTYSKEKKRRRNCNVTTIKKGFECKNVTDCNTELYHLSSPTAACEKGYCGHQPHSRTAPTRYKPIADAFGPFHRRLVTMSYFQAVVLRECAKHAQANWVYSRAVLLLYIEICSYLSSTYDLLRNSSNHIRPIVRRQQCSNYESLRTSSVLNGLVAEPQNRTSVTAAVYTKP